MSDHDAAPDPMDRAYAQAEAVLNDEAARAARRARVLAAVAREPAASAVPAARRHTWERGGWLAAASVAGLSALVAFQILQPAAPIQEPPVAAPVVPAAAAPNNVPAEAASPEASSPPTPEVRARARSPEPSAQAPVVAQQPGPPQPIDAAPAAPRPPPPPAPAPPPVARAAAAPPVAAAAPPAPSRESAKAVSRPPAAAATRADRVDEVVVTGSRRAGSSEVSEIVVATPRNEAAEADLAARLRNAAAAGRTAAIASLLSKGAAIDAQDEAGNTALMKAVQSNRPAAAALLRRRGASLDLTNRAGDSARDMAASIGDAELKRALGLDP